MRRLFKNTLTTPPGSKNGARLPRLAAPHFAPAPEHADTDMPFDPERLCEVTLLSRNITILSHSRAHGVKEM